MTIAPDTIPLWIAGVVFSVVITAAAHDVWPHLFHHVWSKWQDVKPSEELAELYVVQERVCSTCGITQQRRFRNLRVSL